MGETGCHSIIALTILAITRRLCELLLQGLLPLLLLVAAMPLCPHGFIPGSPRSAMADSISRTFGHDRGAVDASGMSRSSQEKNYASCLAVRLRILGRRAQGMDSRGTPSSSGWIRQLGGVLFSTPPPLRTVGFIRGPPGDRRSTAGVGLPCTRINYYTHALEETGLHVRESI